MKKTSEVEFYFDFISPYAYLSWQKLLDLKERLGFSLCFRPVVAKMIFDHWGIVPPVLIKPKREYILRATMAYARAHQIPYMGPPQLPFNSNYLLRVVAGAADLPLQEKLIHAFWQALWIEGRKIFEMDQIESLLSEHFSPEEKDEIMSRAWDRSAGTKLRAYKDEAINKQVFGVPSFVLGEELFWGVEALGSLEKRLEGGESFDQGEYRERLSRFVVP